MDLKKDPHLDLTRYSKLFLNIGFVVSLTLCLIAFEWKTYEELSFVDKPISNVLPDEPLDIEFVDVPPPPPVVPQPKELEVSKDITADLSKINITSLTEYKLPPASEDMPVTIPAPEPSGPATHMVPEEVLVEPALNTWELEKQPEGQEAFYKYISKSLKYPNAAKRENVEGRVYVQFIVNTDGSLTDVQVTKGIGFGCDEEAIRVIENAPKWTPGKQRGKPVRVRMSLPIIFKLNK